MLRIKIQSDLGEHPESFIGQFYACTYIARHYFKLF